MTPDRLVPANELVLQCDIVERLGINPTLLANLAGGRRRNAEFPRPVQGRGNRGIWLWSDVKSWYDKYRLSTVEGQRSTECGRRTRAPYRKAS